MAALAGKLNTVLTQLTSTLSRSPARTAGPWTAEGIRRLNMNTTFLMAARAYSTLKGTLAVVGLAALCALALLPVPREALIDRFPSLAGLRISADPSASATVSGT